MELCFCSGNARFTHCSKKAHEDAIKRICRCLQGTMEWGLIMNPTRQMTLNCYVDADFAGLWGQEDKQDPTCIKSRTGFMLEFSGCLLLWVSKLQTEIALSTTEVEYIALSQLMRELLPAKCMLKKVLKHFGSELEERCSHSTVFEDNNGAIALATAPKMNARTMHIARKIAPLLSSNTVE